MTEWTNTEEGAGGLTEVVPLLVEDMLRENDGNYSIGAEWALYVDGILITGKSSVASAQMLRGSLQ